MSKPTWKNPIVKWIDHRLPVFTFIDRSHIPNPQEFKLFLEFWFISRDGFGYSDCIGSSAVDELYR